MAKLNASQIDVTMSAEELALVVRALKSFVTFTASTAEEERAARALIADLSGGADGN